MNTRQGRCLALLVLVVLQTSGCVMDRQMHRDINPDLEIRPKAKEYSPGFTGHSSGYGGYGGYLNGYGPSYWNPRYYYYTGYGQGYSTGF